MTLTLGTGPFAPDSPARLNVRLDGPKQVIVWEPFPRRVRAVLAGETVADSRGGALLHERGILPVYYLPRADLREDLLEPSDTQTTCPYKGDASYWSLRVADRVAADAVWAYPEPLPGMEHLAGYASVAWGAVDTWLEEDAEVAGHLRDPYHRVDVLPASRHVVVRVGDTVLAQTDRPRMLFETGLPARYYVPFGVVAADALRRSASPRTQCPYKGDAAYWTVVAGDAEVADAAWHLPAPLPEAAGVVDRVCFDPSKVTVEVDGEPLDA